MSVQTGEKQLISISEIIYIVYFAVMFGARAIGLYEGMLVYNISLVVGMGLFALKVLSTEHSIAEYLSMGALLLLCMIVYYKTGEKGLLLYFTMMLGMKSVPRKHVERVGMVLLSISFTCLLFLSMIGVIADKTKTVSRGMFGKTLRHSLGYPYPNTMMTTYIILMVLVMTAIGKQSLKVLISVSLVFLFGTVYLFIFSVSRTGLVVAVFYLALNLYAQTRGKLSIVEKCLLYACYPVCLFIAIVMPLLTLSNEAVTNALHDITHTRWGISQYYLTNEPVTLFGTRFKVVFDSKNYPLMIDSSFLYSFLQVGIIAFLILTILFMGMIWYHVKREHMTELTVIVALCLLGLSDPFLFNLSYKNIMFLYVGEVFYFFVEKYLNKGFFGKQILIIKKGTTKVTLPTLPASFDKWKKILQDNCLKLAVGFIVVGTILFIVLCIPGFSANIEGRINTVNEWEFVRTRMSIGNWVALLIVSGAAIRMKMVEKKYDA